MRNVVRFSLGLATFLISAATSPADEESQVEAWAKSPIASYSKNFNSVSFEEAATDTDLKNFLAIARTLKVSVSLYRAKRITDAGLKELVGRANITELSLPPSTTREGLKAVVAGLPHLQAITLPEGITNGDLGVLADLKVLTSLKIPVFKHLTDECWLELAKLKGLEHLELSGAFQPGEKKVKGKGIKQLAVLTKLRWLELDGTAAGDEAMQELKELKSLERLNLWLLPVTDAGIQHLVELPKLEVLILYTTKVGDGGIKHIARMKNIQELDLRHTRVTVVGLKELAGLKTLKSLELAPPEITADDVEALKKALPQCRIVYF